MISSSFLAASLLLVFEGAFNTIGFVPCNDVLLCCVDLGVDDPDSDVGVAPSELLSRYLSGILGYVLVLMFQ